MQLPWVAPLELAARVQQPYWVLLYSGTQASYSGRYSYLACNLAERIEGNDFSALAGKLTNDGDPFGNAWFGYLGYGLKDCLEVLSPDKEAWPDLPHLMMMRFGTVYRFDHEQEMIECWGEPIELAAEPSDTPLPHVASLASNMTKEAYLRKAAAIIEHIHAGDLYQANLTRKFTGTFETAPDSFSLFKRLCEVSPAPYSAYLKLGERAVLSSSPEMFLKVDNEGRANTRPIKGTAPRHTDSTEDNRLRASLSESQKDRAENLMIVDLMRNDLSRSCVPGSVKVESLFDVTSHATIHHMSSTITGQKRADCSTLDLIKHCFPPGSMTGAPKIRAMNLCSELEEDARGIYSGAIGWLGGDGSAELSVVIRTLIVEKERFGFQVGGGVVADSTPQGELTEHINKALGLVRALWINPKQLYDL